MKQKLKAKVRFYGDDIVYEFGRRGSGSRTRMATVSDIKKATEQTLALVRDREMAWYDPYRLKRGVKKPDNIILDARVFGTPIYEGVAAWRFRGESPRVVLVVGVSKQKGELPKKWSSIKLLNI